MKSVEKYIVENYGKRTASKLMSEGIPKLFLKIEAVKKQIKKLEDDRKKVVVPYNNEKDPSKREKLLNILKDLTKKINIHRANLLSMQEKEDEYVSNMGINDELVVSEDTDLGHEDDEPGMLRADLSVIERSADELGEMMARFEESDEEIDFPHWWQAKIINAKSDITAAAEYLKSKLKK